MAIIIHTEDQNLDWARFNLYPDQFVPESEKKSDNWIKSNMDYFANVAYSQFVKGKDTFVHNYNLMKGILRPEDFYMVDPNARSFVEQLVAEVELPSFVQHYSILNTPVNTMLGEQSRRPDQSRVKAFDEDSKNQQLQFQTDATKKFIIENAKMMIMGQLAMDGQQKPDPESFNKMVMEHVQEYLVDYTSLAEKWANHVLEAMKMELNIKEISEDCFRDFLICAREFYHIYENNGKLGVGVENLNPKNVWYLTLPDKKYIHKDAFAAGTVHVMELSEIIHRFNLDKEEIDHLRDGVRELSLFSPRESNIDNPTTSGWDSIKYDTYSPYLVEKRLLAESMLKENVDPMNDFLGMSSNVNTFGNKYIVVQAYWCGKKKIGKLTYVDKEGDIKTMLVDESYEKIPNQLAIEWSYDNQWYKGLKVGSDVFHVEPFELLDYCPIIGVVHEIKNLDEAKSLVDMLKPYQAIWNVCLNQLWRLLEKEIGNVYQGSLRDIPVPKDGDAQDALDMWEEEARNRGAMWLDNSPENARVQSNFNQWKNVDLTRTSEIKSRYDLARTIKKEAYELIGITDQRAGEVAATETATGTNTALSQSYAQTEPYFAQHGYVLNDVYQGILDAVQYTETKKPYSTISYANTEGEQIFIKINSSDMSMKDLKVFATSRPEDQKTFQELRSLAQPMLQNGATPYDVSVMYTTNSIRTMKQVFKSIKDKIEEQQQAEMQLKNQEIQQQQQQFMYEQQQAQLQDDKDKNFEASQNELDRLNLKEIALINKAARDKEDLFSSPEALGLNKFYSDATNQEKEFQLKQSEIRRKIEESDKYLALELEKIKVERERLQAQVTMKRIDSRKPAKSNKK